MSTAEAIILMVIYFITAGIMVGIGVSQLKSKKPVGFYSGERPPGEEELSDVNAWNKKHGAMWVIYGGIIIFSAEAGIMVGDSIWCIVPMCGGIMIPIIFMIWYHHRLIKIYKK